MRVYLRDECLKVSQDLPGTGAVNLRPATDRIGHVAAFGAEQPRPSADDWESASPEAEACPSVIATRWSAWATRSGLIGWLAWRVRSPPSSCTMATASSAAGPPGAADSPADCTRYPRCRQFIRRAPDPLSKQFLEQGLGHRTAARVAGADEDNQATRQASKQFARDDSLTNHFPGRAVDAHGRGGATVARRAIVDDEVHAVSFRLQDLVGVDGLFIGLRRGGAEDDRPRRAAEREQKRGMARSAQTQAAVGAQTLAHRLGEPTHQAARGCIPPAEFNGSWPAAAGKAPAKRTQPGNPVGTPRRHRASADRQGTIAQPRHGVRSQCALAATLYDVSVGSATSRPWASARTTRRTARAFAPPRQSITSGIASRSSRTPIPCFGRPSVRRFKRNESLPQEPGRCHCMNQQR